eukprot:NODE_2398_length_1594_cov_31.668253_g2063_i0.p1 GENE.NODE_2398_length_1594_cov_31.668253_g2063_i0~~NODE_2398_length_1594_cov_31.668253_g2063_i0.p1  ORF type:complete len:278 (+),score=41.36 NODE_2398_length_1594_cov_31.668253_g2063_i0:61-894(+)
MLSYGYTPNRVSLPRKKEYRLPPITAAPVLNSAAAPAVDQDDFVTKKKNRLNNAHSSIIRGPSPPPSFRSKPNFRRKLDIRVIQSTVTTNIPTAVPTKSIKLNIQFGYSCSSRGSVAVVLNGKTCTMSISNPRTTTKSIQNPSSRSIPYPELKLLEDVTQQFPNLQAMKQLVGATKDDCPKETQTGGNGLMSLFMACKGTFGWSLPTEAHTAPGISALHYAGLLSNSLPLFKTNVTTLTESKPSLEMIRLVCSMPETNAVSQLLSVADSYMNEVQQL